MYICPCIYMCAHVCVLDFIGYVFTYICVECFHVLFIWIFFSLTFYSLLDLFLTFLTGLFSLLVPSGV